MASFLLGDYGRSATAIALDNVLLGVLDNNRLALEFGRLSEQMKDILLSLDRRLKNVTDLAVDYYFDKDPGSKIKSKEVYSFKGKQSDSIAIIKQGKAWAVRENNNNHVLLANLQPGDFIGHLPFAEIDHEPFSASVYRSANLSTEKIDVSLFKEEFDGLSYTFKNIIENLSACISATSLMACEFQKKRLDEQLISQ
jgi:CRP-like cAMP-binding protein